MPCLSLPASTPSSYSAATSSSASFLLSTIYLVALPHYPNSTAREQLRRPLRTLVDVHVRKQLFSAQVDELALLALYAVVTFLLWPVDATAVDGRPFDQPVDDELLEFSQDLEPRRVIRAARRLALQMGYHDAMRGLYRLRDAWEQAEREQRRGFSNSAIEARMAYNLAVRKAVIVRTLRSWRVLFLMLLTLN